MILLSTLKLYDGIVAVNWMLYTYPYINRTSDASVIDDGISYVPFACVDNILFHVLLSIRQDKLLR